MRFKSMSSHEEASYISEGIAEDIIIELSKPRDLFVVAGQSSLKLDPAETGPVEAGELLGVKYCLTGSVRLSGDKMRLTVHLSSTEDGRELWAERFDRNIEDIFDVQAEIAGIVTSTVSGRIIAIGNEEKRRDRPKNLAAYDYVLRGIHALELYTNEANNEALESFKKAIELEPDYARAYGLLSLAHAYDAFYYLTHDYSEAIKYGEAGLRIDPYDAKSHCALGMSRMILRDFNKAEHHFTTGLSASPNDELLLVEYGRFEMYVDRTEKALQTIRRAMRLNPYHANWYWNLVGRCLHTLGRFEEAIESFEKVLTPQFFNWAYLAACHHALGNEAEAQRARKRLYEEWPEFTLNEFIKVFPYKNAKTARVFLQTDLPPETSLVLM